MWKLSTNPLVQGLYDVVKYLTPSSFVNSSTSVDRNWDPRSVFIIEGKRKITIYSCKMRLKTVSEDISFSPTCKSNNDSE